MARKKAAPKAMSHDQALVTALSKSGVVDVVRVTEDGSSVKVLYRVSEKRIWLSILEYVLARADGWTAHVCQQYFMRGGRLVYGWNFILQSNDLANSIIQISRLISEGLRVVPKVATGGSGVVESFPLVGASPRRTASNLVFDPRAPGPSRGGPSHKGAYSVASER